MKKPSSVLLVGLTCTVFLGCDRCSGPAKQTTPAATAAAPAPAPAARTNPAAEKPTGQLQIVDIKVGTGAVATNGKKVSVQYTGTTLDGTVFDSTRGRAAPATFVLDSGMVIQGMNEGIKGMKVGGERKLVVPPAMAYGNRSVGSIIPPNSTLVFDIELVKVE